MAEDEVFKKISESERTQTSEHEIKLKTKVEADFDSKLKGKIKTTREPRRAGAPGKPGQRVGEAFEAPPVDLSNFKPAEHAAQEEPESKTDQTEPGATSAGTSDGAKTSKPSEKQTGDDKKSPEKPAQGEEKPQSTQKDFAGGGPYDEEQAQEQREAAEQGEGRDDKSDGARKAEKDAEKEGKENEAEGEKGEGGEGKEGEGGEGELGEKGEPGEAGGEGAGEAGAEGAGEVAGETGAETLGEAGAEGLAEGGTEAGALAGGEGAAAAGVGGAEAAGAAGVAGAEGAAAAGAAATSEFWGPVVIVIIAVIALLLLILLLVSFYSLGGRLGKTALQATGPNSPEVKQLVDNNSATSPVNGYTKIQIDPKDVEYLNDGIIDQRLVGSLNYLVEKHKSIKISHVLTGYENMSTTEGGDSQLVANISAHHDGLAADITEIDFVYKVFEADPNCSEATGGAKNGDVVFYNDLSDELLRLECQGNPTDILVNTTWSGQPAEGLPIKMIYQDTKPDNPHAGNTADPSLSLNPIDQQIYDAVYQPEARRKTHQVIAELLAYPATTEVPESYRVTQLITYSQERDVDPFDKDGTLDKVYGLNRPNNYGLFAMEEAWQNVHIGY